MLSQISMLVASMIAVHSLGGHEALAAEENVTSFNVDQFRANAASVVTDMAMYLYMIEGIVMSKLGDIPFGEHTEPIVRQFFKTLPEYTANCHMGVPERNYSVQKFFSDLSFNLDTIGKHYRELKRNNDKSLEAEKKCLSEHVIIFVVENMKVAETALKLMKVVNKIRDEL